MTRGAPLIVDKRKLCEQFSADCAEPLFNFATLSQNVLRNGRTNVAPNSFGLWCSKCHQLKLRIRIVESYGNYSARAIFNINADREIGFWFYANRAEIDVWAHIFELFAIKRTEG